MKTPPISMTSKTTACCNKSEIKKGPWTPEEDEILTKYVTEVGEGGWRTLPNRAGLRRCGKSCRLRWMNYLRPCIKRGHISPDEEDLILRLHRLLGNRWALIAGRIPGRTDSEIKNYWNTHLSKKLIKQGIDPRTHRPLINSSTACPSSSSKSSTTGQASKVIMSKPPNLTFQTYECSPVETFGNQNLLPSTKDNGKMGVLQNMSIDVVADKYNNSSSTTNRLINDQEDDVVFSSLLDSLINDNGFSSQYLQDNIFSPPLPSSMHNLDVYHARLWEADHDLRNITDPDFRD